MTEDQWYSPNAVTRYTRDQVKWLVPLLPSIRVGVYPRDPKETGYVDGGGKPTFKPGAKFEMIVGIATDLDMRIEKAGADGLMMEFLYAFEPADENFIIEHMAQCLNMSTREVAQRIRNALYYVSGANQKATSYDDYVKGGHKYLRLG